MVRVGVVGVGNIGSIHAEVYKDNPKCELVAVCDIIREKADAAAAKFGAKAFYSVKEHARERASRSTPAACAPGARRTAATTSPPPWSCWRPASPSSARSRSPTSIDEAEKMVALAGEEERRLRDQPEPPLHPGRADARKEWIDRAGSGPSHMINMRMWINNPVETSPWFHLRALHPHSFDVMRYFCGDVKSVAAFLMKGEGRKMLVQRPGPAALRERRGREP